MTNSERARTERLTLRDELALSALKAVNSDDNYISLEDAAKALGITLDDYDLKAHLPSLVAKQCYAFADAFLNEREVIQNKITDDIEEIELWRDLKEGEVYQEGDRVCLHNQKWVKITRNHAYIGMRRSSADALAQRRVRKEDL